jgi:hypothetical protein
LCMILYFCLHVCTCVCNYWIIQVRRAHLGSKLLS